MSNSQSKRSQQTCNDIISTFTHHCNNVDFSFFSYPAGFMYIFTGLFYATEKGVNVRRAQLIFGCLYFVYMVYVYRTYAKTDIVS